MSKPRILLIGAGGHAKSCIDVIEQEDSYIISGLVGLPEEVGTSIFDYPVLGTDEDLPYLLEGHPNALVAFGQIKSWEKRKREFENLIALGFNLPAIISPLAYVSRHSTIGAGTIVFHGAKVNAGSSIGTNCIINSNALIEHDSIIGDHCHLSTGSVVNGLVQVGSCTFIGSSACIREGTLVGERCVVGMGQIVTKDCANGSTLPMM